LPAAIRPTGHRGQPGQAGPQLDKEGARGARLGGDVLTPNMSGTRLSCITQHICIVLARKLPAMQLPWTSGITEDNPSYAPALC
jgi:hypothetical protein